MKPTWLGITYGPGPLMMQLQQLFSLIKMANWREASRTWADASSSSSRSGPKKLMRGLALDDAAASNCSLVISRCSSDFPSSLTYPTTEPIQFQIQYVK